MQKHGIRWKKELFLFLAVFTFGVLVVPVGVYVVGTQIIGAYADDGRMSDLVLALWGNLAELRPAAWILVLSPYGVLMLLRAARLWWKAGSAARRAPHLQQSTSKFPANR